MGELPGGRAQRLDAHVVKGGFVGQAKFGHRHHQAVGVDGRGRPVDRRWSATQFGQQGVVDIDDDLHHAGHRPGGRPDDGAGEDGLAATAGHGMDDHDRMVDDGMGGDIDDQRVGHEGVVEHYVIVRIADHRAEEVAAVLLLAGPSQRQQAVVGR